jgi:Fur family ferric uptake transcriptional regulator
MKGGYCILANEMGCCRDILSAKGIKATKQRIAVIEELCGSPTPLCADDIFMRLKDKGSENLSLSTVYRILDTFVKNDVIVKSALMDGGKALYEMVSTTHRHNLICLRCHKIMPISGCPLKDFEKNLENETGFKISGHKMEIYGLCPECRNKKNN